MVTLRRLSLLIALALALGVAGPSAGEPSPVRAHIKEARKALLHIEKTIGPLVTKTHAMEERLDGIAGRVAAARKIVRKLARTTRPQDVAVAFFAPDYLQALGIGGDAVILEQALVDLAAARAEKKALEPLLPHIRNQLWELGAERKDRIDDLELAIAQLEAVREGDVPIRAGVGGGKLITYSADWEGTSMCESSGRWHINTGLFDGGLQFLPSTWWQFGGGLYARFAYQATKKQQIAIAERVLAVQGPKAWPNCFKPLPVDTDE